MPMQTMTVPIHASRRIAHAALEQCYDPDGLTAMELNRAVTNEVLRAARLEVRKRLAENPPTVQPANMDPIALAPTVEVVPLASPEAPVRFNFADSTEALNDALTGGIFDTQSPLPPDVGTLLDSMVGLPATQQNINLMQTAVQPYVQAALQQNTAAGWSIPQGITVSNTSGYTWTVNTGGPITYNPYTTTATTITVPATPINYTISQNADYMVYDMNGSVNVDWQQNPYTTNITFSVNGSNLTTGAWHFVEAPLSEEEQAKRKEEYARQKIRLAMRSRLTEDEKRRRSYLAALKSPQEQRARDSLRDIITEADYRRYLTNGFVMVKGPSGKFYQVFADGRHTVVYERGVKLAGLCVHTDKECPPTDHVLNLKLLVEMDEAAVWRGANVNWYNQGGQFQPAPGGLRIDNTGVLNARVYPDLQPGDPRNAGGRVYSLGGDRDKSLSEIFREAKSA